MLLLTLFVSTICAYIPFGVGLALSSSVKIVAVALLMFLPTVISARYEDFSKIAFCNVVVGWIPPVWIGLLIWGYAIRRKAKKDSVSPNLELLDWIKPVMLLSTCVSVLSLLLGWLVYRYYLYLLPDTFFLGFYAIFEWHMVALFSLFLLSLLTVFIPKYRSSLYRAGVSSVCIMIVGSFIFSSNLSFSKQREHRETLERFSTDAFRRLAQEYQSKGSYPAALSDVSPPINQPAVFVREGEYRNHGDYFEFYLGSDYQALRFDSRVGLWQTCVGDTCY